MENKIILTEEASILDVLKTNNWLQAIKDEFSKVVEFSSKLEITDFEDKKQIEIVKSSKQWYVTTRNTIKRAFKSKRDINTEENRLNLEAEREVLAVMEKEENRLWEMLEKAELMKLRKENISKLQDRVDNLKKYDFVEDNEVLLNMTEKEFWILLQNKRELFLQIQEQKIKAEQEKIQREKEIEEAKKQARLEAEKEAQRLADIEKQRVEKEKLEAEQKAIREKEELERKQKEELERVEKEKLETIDKLKKEQEQKELIEKKRKEDEENTRLEAEKIEKDNQSRLEKEKKYIAYRDSIQFDKFEKEDWKIVFYKKVWEFIY